ncbi:MAG TPA: hypothetical protein VGK87_04235 [Anaerolineae bacterium]|jgi:hypothetical protein
MSTDTIKQIAVGLITIPSRPVHHEALLETSLVSAIAFYSALRPLMLCVSVTDVPSGASDELGACIEFTNVPISSGILYATKVTIAGEQYPFRVTSTTASTVTVRVYTNASGTTALEVWRPAPHAAAIVTWPAHHEAIIAMMAASFYLNAVSLTNTDYRYAEMLQAVASAYFGRAQATLQQTS